MTFPQQGTALKAGALLAAVMAGLCISPVLLAAPHQQDAASTQQQRIDPYPVTVDARNAPVREVLEMLFKAGRRDYSIGPDVTGNVTLKATEMPVENVLQLAVRSASVPASYTVESGVTLVKAKAESEKPAVVPPVPSASANPTTIEDVPRRVAAVLFLNQDKPDPTAWPWQAPRLAVIETGGVDFRVVKEGDHVPSGLNEAGSDLIVKKITAKDVSLETTRGKKRQLKVALR